MNVVAIIVVSIILLLVALFCFIYKKKVKKSFLLKGGDIVIEGNNDFFNSIVERAPQPRALLTDDFPYILNEKSGTWYYTEKTDGERSILVINNGKVFKAKFGKLTPLNFTIPFKGTCVLDSEFYEGKYYLFDIYSKNGMMLYNKPFHERKTFLVEFEDENLKIKTFLTIEGSRENRERILKDLYKLVCNNMSATNSENTATKVNWKKVYYNYRKHGRFVKRDKLEHNSENSKKNPSENKQVKAKNNVENSVSESNEDKPVKAKNNTKKSNENTSEDKPVKTKNNTKKSNENTGENKDRKTKNNVENSNEKDNENKLISQNNVEMKNSKKSSGETKRKVDGIIIQNDKRIKEIIQLKWKRKELTTCDFYLKYIPEDGVYYLYTVSNNFTHFRELDNKENLIVTLENGRIMKPITTPFINEIHIFKASNEYNDKQYTNEEKQEIKKLMNEIIKNPNDYDKKIIEMSYNGDVWLPFRIRSDKIEPNSYRTVSLNFQVLFDYPSFTDDDRVYYEDINEFTENSQATHTISHAMRDCIFEHISKRTQVTNVLDLACGRGGDFERFSKAGFKNIFGVDNAHNCAKYIRRASRSITEEQTLNTISGYITEDNTKIINDIKTRTEFPKNGFDFIFMNFAIHYILEINQGMKVLKDIINSVSNKGCLFCFTCFDGDKMIAEAKENDGVIVCDTFKIEVNEIERTAKMILPTISKEPREEKLFTSFDLSSLGGEVIETFYPFIEKSPYISASNVNKGLVKYYSFMKCYVILY